jgi:hypothetical protein
VPDSANVTFYANSTLSGINVAYQNGTSSFFLAGSCPQPVHEDLYQAVSNVSRDSRFLRAENGSQFTVDPINSLSQPLDAQNGSVFVALIFNELNLSDPIFPCNLNLVYSNPISQIYVFIPVTSNGTLAYGNETVAAYPGSQLQFNCPQETGTITYPKAELPQQFQVGGFAFSLVSNGTNFVGANGTSYPGFDYAFNVTYSYGNETGLSPAQVVFTWPSIAASSSQEPSPFISAPFQANVVMRWFTNSTGLYLTVTTLA